MLFKNKKSLALVPIFIFFLTINNFNTNLYPGSNLIYAQTEIKNNPIRIISQNDYSNFEIIRQEGQLKQYRIQNPEELNFKNIIDVAKYFNLQVGRRPIHIENGITCYPEAIVEAKRFHLLVTDPEWKSLEFAQTTTNTSSDFVVRSTIKSLGEIKGNGLFDVEIKRKACSDNTEVILINHIRNLGIKNFILVPLHIQKNDLQSAIE